MEPPLTKGASLLYEYPDGSEQRPG